MQFPKLSLFIWNTANFNEIAKTFLETFLAVRRNIALKENIA